MGNIQLYKEVLYPVITILPSRIQLETLDLYLTEWFSEGPNLISKARKENSLPS